MNNGYVYDKPLKKMNQGELNAPGKSKNEEVDLYMLCFIHTNVR